MSEYDIRGGSQKITTVRFNDEQVINIDDSNSVIEIEDVSGSTILIQQEDIDYLIKAIQKSKDILQGPKPYPR